MERPLIYFFIFLFLGITFILLFSKNKKEKYTTLGKLGEKIKDVITLNSDGYFSEKSNDDFGKYEDNVHYDRQSIRKSKGQIEHDYHE